MKCRKGESKEQFLAELKETVLEVMLDDTNDPIVRIDTEITELQNEIMVELERMKKPRLQRKNIKR